MYRSILVPLDGSPFGEHSLPAALSIARRAGGTLHLALVHVRIDLDGVDSHDRILDQRARENDQAYLDSIVKRVTKGSPVPVSAKLLEGPVVQSLHEHSVGTGADLIVMATHGRGPLSRFWLGSVASDLVRQAPMPILLVRPQDGEANLTLEPSLQHLLIPLDGSTLAEQAIEPAIALGSLMDADYTLLRVIRPIMTGSYDPNEKGTFGWGPALLEQLEKLQEQVYGEAQQYVERVAAGLRARSLKVKTRVVMNEHAAAAILDEARAEGADAIALETHGRRGLARIVLGSVADKVVRGAPTLVLVHHPTGRQTGGKS